MSENLWGTLPKPDSVRTPLFLLREQAEILTEATQGVLVGTVTTIPQVGSNLDHYLKIIAPALNHYSFSVVNVSHGMTVYPVTVIDLAQSMGYEVRDEKTLKEILKKILSSEAVHKVVGGLLAQSRDAKPTKG